MEFYLFYLFSSLLVISSLFIVFTFNAIYSAFFLVACFFNGSCLIFLLGSDFIGFLILLIYVGAISVLFLFVIIILNLKTFDNKFDSYFWKSRFFFVFICLFIFIVCIFNNFSLYISSFNLDSIVSTPVYLEWVSCIDSFSILNAFSQILYTYYFYFILLVGFILLLAMVGSVWLTFSTSNRSDFFKTQDIYHQLSRDSSSSVSLLRSKYVQIKV